MLCTYHSNSLTYFYLLWLLDYSVYKSVYAKCLQDRKGILSCGIGVYVKVLTSSHRLQLLQCTIVVVITKVDTFQWIIILSALGLVSHI